MSIKNSKIVFLTGAGVSAESGIETFRGGDGLWENHRFEDLASPQAWNKNPELVLRFYNERRRKVIEASPNLAHLTIAQLQNDFDVHIVTQNVDDLHERAGSKRILHLHGEIRKSQSSSDPSLVYEIVGPDLKIGDKCEKGSQLRPHVVWFGEAVTNIELAADIVAEADILVIVGTSLVVYPAAGLLQATSPLCRIFLIDPAAVSDRVSTRLERHFRQNACSALPELAEQLRGELA